jgi:hypothetical protein
MRRLVHADPAPGPVLSVTRLTALVAFALLLLTQPANAQLHWDASAEAGVMKRFLSSKPPGGGDAGFGPVVEIHGHIALLPLLRLGAYVAHDIAPMPGDVAALQITSFGARVKGTSPWPLDPWHIWAFAGLGYAGVYGPSYSTRVGAPQTDVSVAGAGGGFFELPFGVGISYKLRRPWHVMAELSGRGGFGFSGSVFDLGAGRTGTPQSGPTVYLSNPGVPSFGTSFVVGLMVDL